MQCVVQSWGCEELPVDRTVRKSKTTLKPAQERVHAIVFHYSGLFMNAGLRYSVNVLGTFFEDIITDNVSSLFPGTLNWIET